MQAVVAGKPPSRVIHCQITCSTYWGSQKNSHPPSNHLFHLLEITKKLSTVKPPVPRIGDHNKDDDVEEESSPADDEEHPLPTNPSAIDSSEETTIKMCGF